MTSYLVELVLQYTVDASGGLSNPQLVKLLDTPEVIIPIGISQINNGYAYISCASVNFGPIYKILIFKLNSTGDVFDYVGIVQPPDQFLAFLGYAVSFYAPG